jgi:F0F1-type ATP synthase membrane subunit c/vacuolar-type H+-ATPase subunit K
MIFIKPARYTKTVLSKSINMVTHIKSVDLIKLQWLAYTSLIITVLYILWDRAVLAELVSNDPSFLSLAILFLLLAGLFRGGWTCWRLDHELHHPTGALEHYESSQKHANDFQAFIEHLRGPQELGWFLSGLATKLGLLGTVIGFMLMMGAVAQAESFDFDAAQDLIRRMTSGIGVALTTTLMGVSVSILLSIQNFFIERFGEHIIAEIASPPAPSKHGEP